MNEITAVLVFDSALTDCVVGTRSGFSRDRTLLYQTDVYSIDLVVHSGSDRMQFFHGQLTRGDSGRPPRGARVRLGDSSTVESDDYGQFALSSMGDDIAHSLHLEVPGSTITLLIPSMAT